MKYSSTVRLINVIMFVLLAGGFGALGIYFSFFVAPYLFIGRGPIDLPEMSYGLPTMLGSFGLAGLAVSLYGLGNSIVSMLKEREDAPVIRSFGAYVAVGYLISLFFLVNAVWLYRLTSSNIGYDEIGFVIVVYAIAFIISIIVSNIPVLKMFGEKEELNKIMKIFSGSLLASTFALALNFGIAFLVSNSVSFAHQDVICRNLGLGAIIFIVATILSCCAFFGYRSADKKGVIKKANGILFEGSLLTIGAAIIVAGVLEYLSQNVRNPASVSFVGKTTPNTNPNYMEFSVMAFIFGGLIVLGALALVYSTLKGDKKEAITK